MKAYLIAALVLLILWIVFSTRSFADGAKFSGQGYNIQSVFRTDKKFTSGSWLTGGNGTIPSLRTTKVPKNGWAINQVQGKPNVYSIKNTNTNTYLAAYAIPKNRDLHLIGDIKNQVTWWTINQVSGQPEGTYTISNYLKNANKAPYQHLAVDGTATKLGVQKLSLLNTTTPETWWRIGTKL